MCQPGQPRELQISQGYVYRPCVPNVLVLSQQGPEQLQREGKELSGSVANEGGPQPLNLCHQFYKEIQSLKGQVARIKFGCFY